MKIYTDVKDIRNRKLYLGDFILYDYSYWNEGIPTGKIGKSRIYLNNGTFKYRFCGSVGLLCKEDVKQFKLRKA